VITLLLVAAFVSGLLIGCGIGIFLAMIR